MAFIKYEARMHNVVRSFFFVEEVCYEAAAMYFYFSCDNLTMHICIFFT